MTDDLSALDNLRPEVAQALGFIERNQKYGDGSVCAGDIDVIRAELVRLARENAELRRAWDDALLTGTGILKVERVDPATVMLPVAPRQGKGTPVPRSEHEALTERAEKAEAELAALKARIAGSDAGIVTQTFSHLGSDGADTTTVEAYPPKVFHHTAIGQRVRLVVEE